MAPLGLFGELTMTAFVCGVRSDSKAAKSTWKSSTRAGTTTSLPPTDSTKQRYSGKNGANVMNSSPSSQSALKQIVMAAAAPAVMKRFLPAKCVPKRSLMLLASASRTCGLPGAIV